MKKIFIALISLFLFFFAQSSTLAAEQESTQGAMLKFAQVDQLPQGSTIAVPVYLNTQGKELNSLQLKIAITGGIENLEINVNSDLPVQEIAKQIADEKNIFIAMTSLDLGTGWITTEDTELLTISFKKSDEGEIKLSFDQEQTLAGSTDSDGNVLTVGNSITIKVGPIDQTAETVASDATAQAVTEDTVINAKVFTTINNNLLIIIMIVSFLAALITGIYVLKSKKQSTVKDDGKVNKIENKPEEPQLPLN
jgi:hypothetical protein